MLKEIISKVDKDVEHWPFFEEAFLKFIETAQIESRNDFSFRSSIKSFQGNGVHRNSQFKQTSDEYEAKSPPLDSKNNNSFSIDLSSVSLIRDPSLQRKISNKLRTQQSIKLSFMNSYNIPTSPCAISSKPGKNELRDTLECLINQDDYIMKPLITKFHIKFEQMFAKDLAIMDHSELSETDLKTYEDVCIIIKCVMRIIRDFIKWMYSDMIKKVESNLDYGEQEAEWMIESIVYKFLFSQPKSVLNRFTFGLFKKKYMEATNQLKKCSQERNFEKIGDDEDFVSHYPLFLLKDMKIPYEVIIKQIAELRSRTNSYQKFEVVIALNIEIFRCARDYYNHNPNIVKSLIDKFEIEAHILILINCVLKDQNPELVVNKAFIGGLADVNCQQAFSTKPCHTCNST